MDSIFKISKLGDFGLLVEGLESDAGQYLPEDTVAISHRAYRWDHSVTINTLASLDSLGKETFRNYHIVNHEECCSDRQEIQLEEDGLYRIAHIILPTKKWFDYAAELGETFTLYDNVYYYDNGKFYLYNNLGETKEITFEELYKEIPLDRNTIIRSDKNTFTMYYLNKCFNTLLKNLLQDIPKLGDNCGKCLTPEIITKQQERDLVWMVINVIKYSLEVGQLYEAQRFLEKFNRCNNICSRNNLKLLNTVDNCGCY